MNFLGKLAPPISQSFFMKCSFLSFSKLFSFKYNILFSKWDTMPYFLSPNIPQLHHLSLVTPSSITSYPTCHVWPPAQHQWHNLYISYPSFNDTPRNVNIIWAWPANNIYNQYHKYPLSTQSNCNMFLSCPHYNLNSYNIK